MKKCKKNSYDRVTKRVCGEPIVSFVHFKCQIRTEFEIKLFPKFERVVIKSRSCNFQNDL